MPRIGLALILIVSLLVSLPTRADTPDLAGAIAAMARIGRAWAPSFSPDGKRIAYITDLSGVPQVWVVGVEGGYPQAVTAFEDPVTDVTWSPTEDWLAIEVAPGGGLNSQIYVARSDGSGLRCLTDGGKENNWLGDWTRDGSRLTLASSRRTPAAMDAYFSDPRTGAWELVAENEGIGVISAVSRDNRWAVLQRQRSRGDNDLYLIEIPTRRETRLTPHTPPALFGSADFGPDSRTIYLTTNDGRDLTALGRIVIDAAGTPGPIEVLAERSNAELEGVTFNEQGTTAALIWNVAGRAELEFLDARTGRISPGPRLPNELLGGATFSPDGRRLAFVSSGSTAPADIWVYEARGAKTRQVTHSSHAGVDLASLVKPEQVTFRAHDGLELSGWLYVPRGFARPGPLVLSFHGGPEGMERPAFRSDYQALLLRGIAVLAPNVRGSSGFGKKFVNLDNGPLRVNGVKDIEACVNYVVSNGIADAGRIGITGGSYGGYMTMAGLTEFPDLFAAGADLFGIVNFETFFKHTEPWMAAISTVEYGDPATQAEMLTSLSPIHKLDRIKAATMVLHGANDTNVPVVEAEQIVEHLRKRNVPVEYVLFPDEGHGWRKVPNRIRSTVEITLFFSEHLKGKHTTAQQEK